MPSHVSLCNKLTGTLTHARNVFLKISLDSVKMTEPKAWFWTRICITNNTVRPNLDLTSNLSTCNLQASCNLNNNPHNSVASISPVPKLEQNPVNYLFSIRISWNSPCFKRISITLHTTMHQHSTLSNL